MFNNSGGQSGPSRGIRLSFLTAADQTKFEQLFTQGAASFGGNKLPANVVSDLLRRSNLDNESLAAIWDLSSVANAPFLTFPEFAVAMFLTSKKITGQQLPSSLPPNIREETEIAMATIASTETPPSSQPLVNTTIPAQQQQFMPQVPMMTGMTPQMTGMPPQMTGMTPQMTGMVPMMTGMPMNNNFRPTPPPVPQLPMQTGYVNNYQAPMQTGFQPTPPKARLQNLDFAKKMMPNQNGSTNLLQSLGSSDANKLSWKISPEDRQRYKEIFQAWEGSGSGYMSGDTAKDVFTQSQLPPADLMKIWTLADKDNKGSLDEDEFAIGMHLLYRKLNGYEIPTSLPAELVPPSSVLKKFVLGRRPPPSTPSFGTSQSQQQNRYQQQDETSDDDSYDYVSSSRRKGPQTYTRSYSSSRYRNSDDEADVIILEDLRRQIYETKRALDRIPKPSKPTSSYSGKYSVEELKEKIRRAHDDINNSLRTNPAHKQYLSNVETMSELLETEKELQDEIQYLCNRDIPVLARQLRSSAAELRDTKVRHSKRADTSQDYMSFVQPTGPGGSITESDRVRAKAKAMMAARKAGNTGSTADASFVLRRAEEEKEATDKKADAIERDMEKSRTALLDMRADLRFLEELAANKDVEDKKRFENGHDLSYELRRFIEQLDNRVPEPYSSRQVDYKSSPVSSGYKSPSVSSPATSTASPKPKPAPVRPRTAEEIKKEAERRVQERLAAIQAKRNPTKTASPTPTISKPNEAEVAAQQKLHDAELQAQESLRNSVLQREDLDRKKREADLERLRENERVERQRAEEAENARKQQEEEDKKRREQEDREFEERKRQILAKEEADRQARFDAIQREEEEAEAAKNAQKLDRKPEEVLTPPPAPQAPAPPPAPVPESSTTKTPSAINSNNPFAKIQQTSTSVPPPGSSQAEKPNEAPNKRASYNPFAAFSAFSATKGGDKDDSDSEDEGWDEKHDDSDDEKEFPAAGSAKNLAGMLFSAMSKRTGSDVDTTSASSPNPDEVEFSTPTNDIPPPPPAPIDSFVPPPPPAPAAPIAPPPATINESQQNAAAPPPGGDLRNALLGQIQLGTKLKKTVTNDRSASSVSGRVLGDDTTFTPVQPVPAPAEIVAPVPIAAPLSSSNFLSELQARTNDSTSPNDQAFTPEIQDIPAGTHETKHDELLPEKEYVALWDYPGSGPDDLTFSQEDIILVRDNNDAEDWWFGTCEKTKKTGYFPRNYVQVKSEPVPELNINAKALYDFEAPEGQGCLDLKMDDNITILVKENNDWWRARSSDGREGLVPVNYVQEL